MGKKIVLSEAQFKNYMRRLVKEDTAGSSATSQFKFLADKLRKYASYVEGMGQEYINAYDFVLSSLKSLGATITNVSETVEYDIPVMVVDVDITNVRPYGNGSEDYNSPEEWFDEMVEYEMEYDVIRSTTLNKYFDGMDCNYKNGKVTVVLRPHDCFDPVKIMNMLPDV